MGLAMPVLADRSSSGESQAINVETGVVTTQDFPQYVDSLGTLTAVKKVALSSVVDGQISKIFFSNGQTVAKDAVTVELDTQLADAEQKKSEAAYDAEKKKYERYQQLASSPDAAISQQELDDERVALETAKQDLITANVNLSNLSIKAPFAGVLGDFQYSSGDYITAGETLVDLVDMTQLLANYSVSQDKLPQLKQGQTVTINVGSYSEQEFYGTVNYIASTLSETTREAMVQALVANPDNLLKPGMFISVKQKVGVDKDVLAVPDQAVMADLKGYYVFRVVDNKAIQSYIQLGTREGGLAQVRCGLKKGDVIVTVGQQKLQDGSALSILPARDTSKNSDNKENSTDNSDGSTASCPPVG